MKIDFNQPLIGIDKEPLEEIKCNSRGQPVDKNGNIIILKNGEKLIPEYEQYTLKKICFTAIMRDDENKSTEEDILKDSRLAERIYDSSQAIQIGAKDLERIRLALVNLAKKQEDGKSLIAPCLLLLTDHEEEKE